MDFVAQLGAASKRPWRPENGGQQAVNRCGAFSKARVRILACWRVSFGIS
jgi:hypothetical protein